MYEREGGRHLEKISSTVVLPISGVLKNGHALSFVRNCPAQMSKPMPMQAMICGGRKNLFFPAGLMKHECIVALYCRVKASPNLGDARCFGTAIPVQVLFWFRLVHCKQSVMANTSNGQRSRAAHKIKAWGRGVCCNLPTHTPSRLSQAHPSPLYRVTSVQERKLRLPAYP